MGHWDGMARNSARGAELSKLVVSQGYLPANIDRRQVTLDRKREEYHIFVKQYYHTRHDDIHKDTFRQVSTTGQVQGSK